MASAVEFIPKGHFGYISAAFPIRMKYSEPVPVCLKWNSHSTSARVKELRFDPHALSVSRKLSKGPLLELELYLSCCH